MERIESKNRSKKETFTVFSQRLAGTLMSKGFRLISMSRNHKYPKKNVFVFPDSDLLRDAIDKYKAGDVA